jgi:hypothetical protein
VACWTPSLDHYRWCTDRTIPSQDGVDRVADSSERLFRIVTATGASTAYEVPASNFLSGYPVS